MFIKKLVNKVSGVCHEDLINQYVDGYIILRL